MWKLLPDDSEMCYKHETKGGTLLSSVLFPSIFLQGL